MNYKAVVKYSLVYVLFTTFLKFLYYLVFNIQYVQDIGASRFIFNPINYGIVFILCLVFLLNQLTRAKSYRFVTILFSVFSFIILATALQYLTVFIFYHLNNSIHPSIEYESIGITSLIDETTNVFHKPHIAFLENLFIHPIENLIRAIRSGSLKFFILTIFKSKIILASIVVYFYSLYRIFEKFNQKPIDALIPIQNNLVLLKITQKPTWWIVPLIIPIIRLVPKYAINKVLAKELGENSAFALGMTLLPFYFYGELTLNKR